MKRTGMVLTVIIGFLLAAGCQSGENIQRLGPTETPTPDEPTPTPTPKAGAVIGRGALDIASTWNDFQPTSKQYAQEGGTIPFEILSRDGDYKVEGQGNATLNYSVEFTQVGTTCTYQAFTPQATVSGSFYGASICDFVLKVTIDYPVPHLISNPSDLCGPMPDWLPYIIDIPQMEAHNGAKFHFLNPDTVIETEVVLNNLVWLDDPGC